MPKVGNSFLKSNRTEPTKVVLNAKNPSKKSIEKAIAAAVRRSEGRFDNEASDTDSLASSVSSYSDRRGIMAGVSPLNRRKSLRLAMKQNSEMQGVPHLSTQNTVRMETPQTESLKRMETDSRWTSHRASRLKSQETVIIPQVPHKPVKLTKGISKWVNYRKPDLSSSELSTVQNKRPKLMSATSSRTESSISLLKKTSTTWGIRAMLGAACLDTIEEGEGASQECSGFDETDSGNRDTNKGKRKVSGPLSPNAEETGKKPRVKKGVTFAKAASGTADSSSKSPARSALKRQRSGSKKQPSLSEDNCFLHKTKRMCIDRDDSIAVPMFIANKRDWPISMDSQVIWRLDLASTLTENETATCVFVNNDRCLVGTSSKSVVELDATVSPSRRLELPSGVTCLTVSGKSIYAGCVDGTVYDISDEATKLLWKDGAFKELKGLSCSSNTLAVIEGEGKVALVDKTTGETLWKEESIQSTGVGVHIDETGLYVTHSNRLAKYSLSGAIDWAVDASDLLTTVCTVDELYTCGGEDILKLSKHFKGQILSTYNKGIEQGHPSLCAVGGGLVFAVGKRLICYDEKSGDVVYNVKLPSAQKLVAIQYFRMRLFCLFTDSLEVLDFTEQSVITGKEGHRIEMTEIELPQDLQKQWSSSSVASAASSVHSNTDDITNDLERKPKVRRGKLKVKATSIRKNARN